MSDTAFKKAYTNLNPKQKQAVDAIEGPVMVVAGPGTGKTTILTLRIANILKQTQIDPENILALTFTNSGVLAMRQKLLEYIGDEAYRVGIFTFHSFAENVIREFPHYFPQFEFARVAGDLDKVQILEGIIQNESFKELTNTFDPFASLSNVVKAIDDIKFEGLSPQECEKRISPWEKEMLADPDILYKRKTGDYQKGDIKPAEKSKIEKKVAKAQEVVVAYKLYQEKLSQEGLYDFSDMILTVLGELESNENLKLDLQEQYQYILVDEHQDTNAGQNRLIELLTDAKHLEGRPNLFTVGDEKQSIYRFQGASADTFAHFQKKFQDVKVITLEDNYRSTEDILESAHSLIDRTIPNSVKLSSHQKESKPITVAEFSNYKFELLWVANQIREKLESGVSADDIAVIYRKNKHIDDITHVFNTYSIPYTILSKDNILSDPDISNVISVLRVVFDPTDNHSLAKALFARFLNINAHDVVLIMKGFRTFNRQENKTLFTYISDKKALKDLGVSDADVFVDFAKQIVDLKTASENEDIVSFLKEFLEKVGYTSYMLKAPDSRDQLIRIDKIFDEIKRQRSQKNNYNLKDFLVFVDSYEKYNLSMETDSPEVLEGIQLLNAHKSKGLEFEYVYMVGASRSNWEKSRGFPKISLPIDDYKGNLDDERRLFYVAMTRAKKELAITSSLTDWEGREQDASQFVTEIENGYKKIFETREFEKTHLDDLNKFIIFSEKENSIWDTKYLKNLFMERGLSVTALNNFIECPIKYLFRNLIQIPSEYVPNLIFGDAVHQALDRFFKDCRQEEKILSKEVLLNYFHNAMEKSSLYGNDYKRYLKHGDQMLDLYFDEYKDSWSWQVITEQRLKRTFNLSDGKEIKLTGIIDKIEFLDPSMEGKIVVVDYKTGKTFSEKNSKDQKNGLERQIIFYHILLEGFRDGKCIIQKAILDFIEKNKKGEFEQKTLDVSDDDVLKLKQTIEDVSKDIMSGKFLKGGCGKKNCEYCILYHSIQK